MGCGLCPLSAPGTKPLPTSKMSLSLYLLHKDRHHKGKGTASSQVNRVPFASRHPPCLPAPTVPFATDLLATELLP